MRVFGVFTGGLLMKIIFVKSKSDYKNFLAFKYSLYKNDKNYVDTASFVLEDVLYQKTPFTKECDVQPIMAVSESGEIKAEAILLFHKALPYLQIAFFEAVENAGDAVNAILVSAKEKARQLGIKEIIIGLNAHISYGVGILTSGFEYKNSFDSLYNKNYYKDYFSALPKETLSTYRGEVSVAKDNLMQHNFESEVRIETARINDIRSACARMQALCEKTISKTFLYYKAGKDHFYYLMKDLAPFLKDENLLFAVDKNGNDIGFVFWHPEFNQMLEGGVKTSTLKILYGYLFKRKDIESAKLNAVGSLSAKATSALLLEFCKRIEGRYKYLETNFVWDNNVRSTHLNQRFFGQAHRKYEVYFLNADSKDK